jgi:hypothetical protein
LERRGREAEEFFKKVENPPEELIADKPVGSEGPTNVENHQSQPQILDSLEPLLDEMKEREEECSVPADLETTVPETQPEAGIEQPPETEEPAEDVAKKPEIDYDIFDEEKAMEIEGDKDTMEAVKCYTPVITGTADEIIDLETGDVMRRPLTGPELLLDQMLRSRGLKNRPVDEEKTVS